MRRFLATAIVVLIATVSRLHAQCDEWLPTAGPSELLYIDLMTVADHDGAGPQPPLLYARGAPNGGFSALFRWDGTRWEALPSYFQPQCLYTLDAPVGNLSAGSLLVGAYLSTSEPDASRLLRAWDGQAFSIIGPTATAAYSSSAQVLSLTTWDPDGPGPQTPWLIVGGIFTRFANVAATNIVAWDGVQWRALGAGRSGSVPSLLSFDPDGDGPALPLLVAGAASWNGTAWQTMGAGLNGPVNTLTTFDRDGSGPLLPELYAGGAFTASGTATLPRVARWNGTAWVAPWTGAAPSSTVNSLAGFDPDGAGPLPPQLVAAGSGICVLANEAWTRQEFGSSTSAHRRLAVLDPDGAGPRGAELVLGGSYGTTPVSTAIPSYGPFAWDGTRWASLGSELLGGMVQRFHRFDPDGDGPLPASIYAAGSFTMAGGRPADGLAVWNGNNWDGLGTPTPDAVKSIHRLVTYDPDGAGPLAPWLVGTDWRSGISMRVMRWSGTAWVNVDVWLSASQIYSACVIDADADGPQPARLFVSGRDVQVQFGPYVSVVAYSTGPRFALAGMPDASAMSIFPHDPDGDDGPLPPSLYAFGTTGTLLSRFDGTSWTPLASGSWYNAQTITDVISWDPDAAGPHAPMPVIGSASIYSGGVEYRGVAAFNGQRFKQLGDLLQPALVNIRVMYSFDPDGAGPAAGQLIASGWDDNTRLGKSFRLGANAEWTPFTGQFGNPLTFVTGSSAAMITVDPDEDGPLPPELWIGGAFNSAGGRPAANFARWRLTGALPTITQNPVVTARCANMASQFALAADGHGAGLTYQWRIETATAVGWQNLSDGPVVVAGQTVGTAQGAATPTLSFRSIAGRSVVLQCIVSTPCGSIMTAPIPFTPAAPCCGTADFNNDGDVGTDQDIEAFFACLSGTCCAACPTDADFNGDGDVGTDQDIEAFFRVLAGGSC